MLLQIGKLMRYETIATLATETFLITPLEEGQALHFEGDRITGPVGEPIRVYGTGPVEISQGKWGNRLRVTGYYEGPYFDGSTLSTVPAETLTLQRQIGAGEWVTVAEGVALDDAVTDPLPLTNGVTEYRAITRTSLRTQAVGAAVRLNPQERRWIYFNHGPDFSRVCRAFGNPAVEVERTRNRAAYHMAGRAFPVTQIGVNQSEEYSFEAVLTDDATPESGWDALAYTDTLIAYRDPAGRRVFATLGPLSLAGTRIVTVSTTFSRNEYTEGVPDAEPSA